MTDATLPLDGTELLPLVQGGANVKTTVNDLAKGVKIYRALLTGLSDGTITAVVLENTLGGVPVWHNEAEGSYSCTLAGAFPAEKTFIMCGTVADGVFLNNNGTSDYESPPTFVNNFPDALGFMVEDNVTSNDVVVYRNDALSGTAIEIRVYP